MPRGVYDRKKAKKKGKKRAARVFDIPSEYPSDPFTLAPHGGDDYDMDPVSIFKWLVGNGFIKPKK